MRGANPRAGEHRDRQLRNQRHVQRDAITFFHADLLQHVCKATDFSMQLLIGERSRVAGLAFPNQSRFVTSPGSEMTVEAVVRDIDLAAGKPLRMRWLPLQYALPFLEPVEFAFRKTRPE